MVSCSDHGAEIAESSCQILDDALGFAKHREGKRKLNKLWSPGARWLPLIHQFEVRPVGWLLLLEHTWSSLPLRDPGSGNRSRVLLDVYRTLGSHERASPSWYDSGSFDTTAEASIRGGQAGGGIVAALR